MASALPRSKGSMLNQPIPLSGSNPLTGVGKPNGAQYIDTGVCQCAERTLPDGETIAWRCIGEKNVNVYDGTTGAWFLPQGTVTSDVTELPIDDATNPPNLDIRFVFQGDKLVPVRSLPQFPLNKFDAACTGENNTLLSAHYYDSLRQTAAGKAPSAAALCFTGTLPVTIQTAQSWQAYGCYEGFLCPNNTINALPQYCTPVPECLHARLGGASCGVAMGVFEPIVCPAGSYCPAGATEAVPCPRGSYCPEGSSRPLKCSPGAICSGGAEKNATWLPFVFLVIIDVALVLAIAVLWLFKRNKSRRLPGASSRPSILAKAVQAVPLRKGGAYKNLEDDAIDLVEQQPADGDIGALRRRPTGFRGPMVDFDMDAAAYSTRKSNDDANENNADLREFVGSLSKCLDGSTFGLSFEYTDLGFWPKGSPRPILSNITGRIPRGALAAVLGGSGAGKSTFVNALMGKQTHTTGRISINGVQGRLSEYKKIIGYVPQDDVVLPELTVRENILHSARVRLPSHWRNRAIEKHVDTLIECLELGHVRDSLVGSTAKPIISGGQRKRVSIGMELAAAPMALFLDEPTSGLDATSASHIMKILTALSKLGITVVTIIHQPREEIWRAIDDIVLLANGRLVYQGQAADVKGYFERAGFSFPQHSNPADVVMDIIQGEGRHYKRAGEVSKDSLIENWHQISTSRRDEDDFPARPGSVAEDATSFRRSIRRRGAYFHKQVYYCMARSFLQQYRLKAGFWFEIGVASLAGGLIGLALNSNDGKLFHGLYHGQYIFLSSSLDYQTIPILSLLVAIGIGLVGSAPGVKVFGEEKLQYRREAASGHNKLAYYIGKLIATIPRMILGCFHFTVLFLLLTAPRISWGRSFLVNLLYYYCMYGLASCVSMVTRREDGPLLATIASLIVGILSGFAPRLSEVADWHMLWLWRSSPGTWIAESYFSENILPLAYLFDIDDAAAEVGMTLGRYGTDSIALFGIGTAYRVLAFVLLVLVRRGKQR